MPSRDRAAVALALLVVLGFPAAAVGEPDSSPLGPEAVRSAVGAGRPLDLPFLAEDGSSATVQVHLRWHDLLAGDAVVAEDGNAVARDATVTLRGSVAGMPDADARFALTEDGLYGAVLADASWTFYVPARWSDPAAPRGALVLLPFVPGAGAPMPLHDDAVPSPAPGPVARIAGEPTPRVARLFLDGDNEFYLGTGTTLTWQQRQLALLNLAEPLFERELTVTFEVVGQHAWTTRGPDYPFDRTPGPFAYLHQFRDHWEFTEPGSFRPRDEAVLFTGQAWSEAYGFAFIEALADPWAYAIVWSTFVRGAADAYTPHQTVLLLAHEMGHNFGGLHERASLAYVPGQPTAGNALNVAGAARTIMEPSIRFDAPQFSDGSWLPAQDNKHPMLGFAAARLGPA